MTQYAVNGLTLDYQKRDLILIRQKELALCMLHPFAVDCDNLLFADNSCKGSHFA
jgi:hypothetical protein